MAALSSLTAWSAGTHRPAAWTQRASAASRWHGAHGPHAEAAPRASGAPAERVAARRACAFVFIANLPHLAEAYGQDFASAASLEVQRRLCATFTSLPSCDMARLRDDCFLVWANEAFDCEASGMREPGSAPHASRPIETLLAVLGTEPVRAGGIAALVQLHADWIDVRSPEQLGASEVELMLWTAQPFPDSRESRTDGWRQLYRADMDVAVRVSEALRAEELSFSWQPVVHPGSIATTLYRAGRARIAPSHGEAASLAPEVFTPCLQRLGLTRAFDRTVMRRAVAALRLQPSVHVGVSISAQGVRIDHWWASLLAVLDKEPALASRLVIEIADSAALPDLEAAHDFCVQLQLRGCRVAIRDFGGGADNLAAVQACGPDIVKLDAALLRRARDSEFGRECLRGMLAMCVHFAPHVVVDGVERDDDVHIASNAGAQWLQGYGIGREGGKA
ncbi:EAL domain-containing protein [Variovorax sp. CAN2819]|uniref:EAL domain-containing protein n=1 Tax=Variovorax sp. CAN15 TaxID=3046727 RepID=UPI00264A4375|nr:EAL domain-containing protein [Variovorax sp. CAN15]MDN6887816.1 EAL domain-containing protein [Variovorax sp. CAN15]